MDQRKSRALQHVRRFNFERCNRYQSVAEHSLLVALLCYDAAAEMGLDEREREAAAVAGMSHDLAEAVTGDIPYLVRRELGAREVDALDSKALHELGARPVETRFRPLVEFCDALELLMYLKEEAESGNVSLARIEGETMRRLRVHPLWDRLSGWVLDVVGMDATEMVAFDVAREMAEFSRMKH